MPFRIASLFSGCGGLDWGFHNHGDFQHIYAADNDLAAVKCFSYNFGHKASRIDVSTPEFLEEISNLKDIDVILGGFPCQGFSKAGPKVKEDPRNLLYLSMKEAIKTLKPTVFVAENVDGMAQNFQGEYVNQIFEDFTSIGYTVSFRILNAVDYGVPQYRRRIVFVGIKNNCKSKFKWPLPSHQGGSRNGEFKTDWDVEIIIKKYEHLKNTIQSPRSIKQSLSDLLDKSLGAIPDHVISPITEEDQIIIKRIGLGQKLCNVRFANSSVYTWQIPEIFGEVSDFQVKILETIGKNRRKKIFGKAPNGNPLSLETICNLLGLSISQTDIDQLISLGYLKSVGGKYDLKGAMFCSGLYKRPNWDEPSPTVITDFGNPRYFIHPIKNRPFTIRECARLQTFPDDFYFLNSGISVKDAYRLIGNAVPPVLSACIADSIHEVLSSIPDFQKDSHNQMSQTLT